MCYSCTNNHDAANSRNRFYPEANQQCGFAGEFEGRYQQKTQCFTYCMKRETGVVGSRVDVERRCEPTCQEYNGNPHMSYLIDKVSCCIGNLCNHQYRRSPHILLIYFVASLVFFNKIIFKYF